MICIYIKNLYCFITFIYNNLFQRKIHNSSYKTTYQPHNNKFLICCLFLCVIYIYIFHTTITLYHKYTSQSMQQLFIIQSELYSFYFTITPRPPLLSFITYIKLNHIYNNKNTTFTPLTPKP